jgi:hypothetical protein
MRARYARARAHGMVLTAPKTGTFWIAVAMAGLAMLLHFQVFTVAALSPYAFLILAVAFVILAIGCAARGM